MGIVTACDWTPSLVTTTLAVPATLGSGRTSQGTCAAIMFSDTNCNGAAMPFIVTETSAIVVERGTLSSRASPAARLLPKIETMEPGATPVPRSKLAALATPPSDTTGVCACAAAKHQNTVMKRLANLMLARMVLGRPKAKRGEDVKTL
jgi:hypothetical protein